MMNTAQAIVELSGSFSYDRQVFGPNRENDFTSTGFGGSVAFYFFGLTAIELNYFKDQDVSTDTIDRQLDTNFTVLEQEDKVRTTVYGIGIRQAFASRKAFLQPVISLGYAKQYRYSTVEYLTDESGTIASEKFEVEDSVQDSTFASFSIRIRLTKTVTVNGSARTVFPGFETDQARDNIRYTAGFSWFF